MDWHPRQPPHNYEGAVAALDGAGASGACPVCSTNDWVPPGELANLLVGLHLLTPGDNLEAVRDSTGTGGIACYAFVCQNCGFVRLHAIHALEKGEQT